MRISSMVGPRSSEKSSYKRQENKKNIHRGKGHMMGRQRLEWCSHKPRSTCSPQELEEARKEPPLEPRERASI